MKEFAVSRILDNDSNFWGVAVLDDLQSLFRAAESVQVKTQNLKFERNKNEKRIHRYL